MIKTIINLRILFLHNRYQQLGGEDVAVALEQELLKQKGHDVDLLFFENHFSGNGWGSIKRLGSFFYNTRSAKQLKSTIDKFKPDIVHVHNFFFTASPSIFYVCQKRRLPVVQTLHNFRLVCANALLMRDNKPCELCLTQKLPIHGFLYKCYRNSAFASAMVTAITGLYKINGLWKNKIDKFITLTSFAQRKFLNSSLSLNDSQMVVKPNFTSDYGFGPLPRQHFYLFVGRISTEKGIDVLVETFSQSKLPLILLGDGPERMRLEDKLKNQTNIQFLGSKSKEEVIGFMKKAKALVFPSLWYEGMPYTIIESFSTGTPVIASYLGSMKELVVDGYNGFHFETGNTESLLQVLLRFENEGNGALYTNARNTYLEKYTPDEHYSKIIKIYEEVIGIKK